MTKDKVRAAVYHSLIKPLPVGCKELSDPAEYGTIGSSKTLSSGIDAPLHCKRSGSKDPVPWFLDGNEAQPSDFRVDTQPRPSMTDLSRRRFQGAAVEPLFVLGQLKEGSGAMPFKNKQGLDFLDEKGRFFDKFGADEIGSRRFLHEARPSVDGSSRNLNSIEELKKVIRDSFRKQNLLPVSDADEDDDNNNNDVVDDDDDDDDDVYSGLSLRFSTTMGVTDQRLCHWDTREIAAPPTSPVRKPGSSNLIAKLMGLDDISSTSGRYIKREGEASPGARSQRFPFDSELLRSRSAHCAEQSHDSKQKSLEDIIQTMQLKGLLKGDQFRSPSPVSTKLRAEEIGRTYSKDDDAPPIVVMKPLHLQVMEREEARKDTRLNKVPMIEELHPVKFMQERRRSIQMTRKEDVQFVQEENDLIHGRMLSKKYERKEPRRIEKSKLDVPQRRVKQVGQDIQKLSKEVPGGRRKFNVEPHARLNAGRLEEKMDLKSNNRPPPEAMASISLPKIEKKDSMLNKNASRNTGRLTSSDQNYSDGPRTRSLSSSTKERRTIEVKSAKKSSVVKDQKRYKDDSKEIASPPTKGHSISDDYPIKPVADKSKKNSKYDTRKEKKIQCDDISKTWIGPGSPRAAEEVVGNSDKRDSSERKISGIEVDLKHLFLSSQPFVSQVQDLLNLGSDRLMYRKKDINKVGMKNAELLLDCAMELMARKRYQRDLVCCTLLQTQVWPPILFTSFDQLVDQIASRFEKLISYQTIAVEDDINSEDSLYIRLGKDLQCKDTLINAMWDIGWETWMSMEDATRVVCQMEELILSCLIDEIVVDLV